MDSYWSKLALIGLSLLAAATGQSLVQRAHQAEGQGNMQQAVQFYNAALEAEPQSFDALTGLGMLLGQAGQHKQTVKLFKKAIKLVCKGAPRPDVVACVGIKMNMGYSYMQMRNTEKALKVYKNVIKLDPKTREAYLKAASVLRDLGRQPEVVSVACVAEE
jgi:tetratricopeptide (TPR) repeat protein